MKLDDLLDAIGEVDDVWVKRAKEKKKTHRALWAVVGTLAACICIVMMLPKGILNDSSNQAQDEEIYKNIWIYYVKDGEVCKEQEYILAQAMAVFSAWKEKNGIGDEVELIQYSPDTTSIIVSANLQDYYGTIDRELLLDSLKQTMAGYSNLEYDKWNLYYEEESQ